MSSPRPHYTPTYQSWQAMRQRCLNPNHKHYSNYGGRGIQICERWDSFAAFLEDMGERPPGTSLDRRKNDLGYFKKNCKWSTRSEQNRNNAQNRIVEFAGRRECLTYWCDLLDINYDRTRARIVRLGWSVSDAFLR